MYLFDSQRRRGEIKSYNLQCNAITKYLENNDESYINYPLNIQDLGMDFHISTNPCNNWYHIFVNDDNYNIQDKIKFLLFLYKIKHLKTNFLIEFYNICILYNKADYFYDDISSLLSNIISKNTNDFNFIEHRDHKDNNIINIVKKIKHKKALSIINMYNINTNDNKNENLDNHNNKAIENDKLTCMICMDCQINTCIKKCGHSSFCYDCVRLIDQCPICRVNFCKSDLIKIYFC